MTLVKIFTRTLILCIFSASAYAGVIPFELDGTAASTAEMSIFELCEVDLSSDLAVTLKLVPAQGHSKEPLNFRLNGTDVKAGYALVGALGQQVLLFEDIDGQTRIIVRKKPEEASHRCPQESKLN